MASDPIRARLDSMDLDDLACGRICDEALRAVLDLCDHGGTLPVAEWVSAPVLRAVIAEALGVKQ